MKLSVLLNACTFFANCLGTFLDCRFHFSVFRKWHSLYNTQFFAGRNAGANSVVGWDEIVETTV